jgi:broad specificity phosphatase PhoE
MSMLKERLQVMIDRDQRERLERRAKERGTSVAMLVREAIDLAYPSDAQRRREAADAILAAEPMEVPDVDDLLAELDEIRSRRFP